MFCYREPCWGQSWASAPIPSGCKVQAFLTGHCGKGKTYQMYWNSIQLLLQWTMTPTKQVCTLLRRKPFLFEILEVWKWNKSHKSPEANYCQHSDSLVKKHLHSRKEIGFPAFSILKCIFNLKYICPTTPNKYLLSPWMSKAHERIQSWTNKTDIYSLRVHHERLTNDRNQLALQLPKGALAKPRTSSEKSRGLVLIPALHTRQVISPCISFSSNGGIKRNEQCNFKVPFSFKTILCLNTLLRLCF